MLDLTRRQSTMFNFVIQLMMRHKGSTIRDLLKLLEEGRGSRTKFPLHQSLLQNSCGRMR